MTGDDLTADIPRLLAEGVDFKNIDDVGDFNEVKDKIFNANVYFGHEPTLHCLEQGANVVITGRSTDSALFLAPAMYKMGWAPDDWDNLARGIMAGHLLECGGQGAGGNYMYDWRSVPRMDELGFPIAELTPDTFDITKAPDCGGLICEQCCKEQFLYEVHDPANYMTPDVDRGHQPGATLDPGRARTGCGSGGVRRQAPPRHPQALDRLPRRLQGCGDALLRLAGRL